LLAGLSAFIIYPKSPSIGGKKFKIQEGLDLQGGTQLIYQADLSTSKNKKKDIDNLRNVFDQRINSLGVSEPNIQLAGNNRIIIELPGVKNLEDAKKRIGATYELVFMEEDEKGQALNDYYTNQPVTGTWKATKLTGRQLIRADVSFDQQATINSQPMVTMTFNREGKSQFADITKRNINKRVAIVLDNKIVSAPNVQNEINSGDAQITGLDSLEEAQRLKNRLNEGILPVPAKLIGQNTVGPTLGKESVQKSLIAGLFGLILIGIFMVSYYKVPGLLAVIALSLYTIFSLALFEVIPVTLTLAGIAGFILSIGMAVDANILIFERMKEELRAGKPLNKSVEEGFKRAWNSVRDSNFSSLITCFILWMFTTGFVKGFALTLGVGILVSMFTAITVSRNLLRLFIGTKLEKLIKI
jgi:preprotein translocase subunit SecD